MTETSVSIKSPSIFSIQLPYLPPSCRPWIRWLLNDFYDDFQISWFTQTYRETITLCEMKLRNAVFCIQVSCRSISVNWPPWQQFSHALYIFPCLQQHTLHTTQLPGIDVLGQRIVNNCILSNLQHSAKEMYWGKEWQTVHTLHTTQLPGIGALGQRIVISCIPCIPPPTSSTRPRKCIWAKNDEHTLHTPQVPDQYVVHLDKEMVTICSIHKNLVFSHSWFGNLGRNVNLHFVGIANNVFSCVSSLILMCHINGAVFLPPNSSFVFVWIELRFQPNSNEQYQLRSFSS